MFSSRMRSYIPGWAAIQAITQALKLLTLWTGSTTPSTRCWSQIEGNGVSLAAQVFRACAQLNLRLSLQLAESSLLPLKMEPYAKVKLNNQTWSKLIFTLNQVMEDGVAFLESSGVLNQVRELGIATTHWEEAVLAFRSTSHHHYIKLENNVF